MIIRILAVVILVSASLATWTTDTASACSCARPESRERIEKTAGSFIGRIISRIESPQIEGRRSSDDHAVYTFAVDGVAKGSIRDYEIVRAPLYGSFCGFEGGILDGDQAGILLRVDDDGNYRSGLCSTMDIGDMKSVAQLYEPEPNPIVHRWLPQLTNLLRRLFSEFVSDFGREHYSNSLEQNSASPSTQHLGQTS